MLYSVLLVSFVLIYGPFLWVHCMLYASVICSIAEYTGTPLNGHPSTADTHDITDNSESPDCPSVNFST